MVNPTKFSKPEAEAREALAGAFRRVDDLDLDFAQDVLEEMSVLCSRKAREIEDAIVDAEGERLRVISRIAHPSLDARERNPSLR